MSELTHQGAFRLIYKRRRTEAEQRALQSHLQHCAECRQDAEMAGLFNDNLVLKELPTRPSPNLRPFIGSKPPGAPGGAIS